MIGRLLDNTAGRIAAAAVALLLAAMLAVVLIARPYLVAGEPERFADPVSHFKYGSIGSDVDGGIPYWIWRVLPDLFPEHLPQNRAGQGYGKFGFLYEPGAEVAHERPIGFSYRGGSLPKVGVNCAACHVGSVREAVSAEPALILGMPAQQLDFLAYQQFLIDVAKDERFRGDVVVPAIRELNPDLSAIDAFFYGRFVIPRMRDEITARGDKFQFVLDQTPWGPGRVDTFSPYKVHFGFPVTADDPAGAADLPSLWLQGPRVGMNLHWDGNNNAVDERNRSAAIGAGASEDSIDIESLGRIAAWIADFEPPPFPASRIDRPLAQRGQAIYEAECASCHSFTGSQVGQVVPIEVIGTDPERVRSFDATLAASMNTLGEGKPWQLTHFKETNGYANMPLDGVWLRAPYLHNGSVPTLRALLQPPEQRPPVFHRGYDVYDFQNLGFVSSGAQAEAQGVRFDTSQRGNGNAGHRYGTTLTPEQVDSLLEFLKTQ